MTQEQKRADNYNKLPGLTIHAIACRCSQLVFNRGKEIYKNEKVVRSHLKRNRWLNGTVVSGVTKVRYTVMIDYCHTNGEIGDDIYCTCPGFQTNPGRDLCKHMVAVLLGRCLDVRY